MFTTQSKVDAIFSNLDWDELVGKHEPFDTMCFAVSTIQKFQRFEELQSALAWKPLEVIRKTLQATTQWATPSYQFPMKKHRESRSPWGNRTRLMETVGMDTYFMATTGLGGGV